MDKNAEHPPVQLEHPLVQLARQTIIEYVRHKHAISPPAILTPEMQQRAGVFVSLHRQGDLRGCIGTFQPTQANVALEIIHNAISAATEDPRFSPVQPAELDDLDISVDVLSTPELVASRDELDPKRYGVIVRSGMHRGLLLPDLEGVDTIEDQLQIAKRKAWIGPNEPIEIMRFEVIRYGQH